MRAAQGEVPRRHFHFRVLAQELEVQDEAPGENVLCEEKRPSDSSENSILQG